MRGVGEEVAVVGNRGKSERRTYGEETKRRGRRKSRKRKRGLEWGMWGKERMWR